MGGVRAAFMRLIAAHIALLRAELGIAGKELGVIVGLAVGALSLAVLVAILLYVGTFLFLGEWLFGSMGWGIIHGTLLTAAVIAAIGVNLAGGSVRTYAYGAVVGLVVAVVVSALLLSNIGNESAEWGRRQLEETLDTTALPFGSEWLTTLTGLAVGALIGLVMALIAGWRIGSTGMLAIIGIVVGGFVGAIYASTRYDAPDGVIGLALMIGLLTWIVVGVGLAYRKGFDTEARYANLVPRESIAAFEHTRDFLLEQWKAQKNRMMGR